MNLKKIISIVAIPMMRMFQYYTFRYGRAYYTLCCCLNSCMMIKKGGVSE